MYKNKNQSESNVVNNQFSITILAFSITIKLIVY